MPHTCSSAVTGPIYCTADPCDPLLSAFLSWKMSQDVAHAHLQQRRDSLHGTPALLASALGSIVGLGVQGGRER